MQALWPEQFLQILTCVAQTVVVSVQHLKLIATTLNKILKASKVTRGVINGVAQEFAEVQQAVNEAAHSRWIKLLASRLDERSTSASCQ